VSLLTVERYRVLTGDNDTANSAVTAAIEDAQRLLADELGRPGIEVGTYTEVLPVSRSLAVYPSVLPILTVPAGYDHYLGVVHDVTPDGAPFWDRRQPTITLTYTGGWDDTTVPEPVARDLAQAAYQILRPTTEQVPSGATSVTLGDASVTFGADGYQGGPGAGISWSAATLRHRKRRL
jgi:hypothetical protein